MTGILSYGTYLPYHRLHRDKIAEALGARAGKGSRTVASFDEDSTSMGVEAARVALRAAPADVKAEALFFATTMPAYLDKTNATAVHAAVGLDPAVPAFDMVGAVRSGLGALTAALRGTDPVLVVLSDVRIGAPGSADERDGGDAAVALLVGGGPTVADLVGAASATGEFLDRWRVPGEPTSRVWEERFGEHEYVPLASQAFTDALKRANATPDEVDHLIVTGVHARAAGRVAAASGVPRSSVVDDLVASVGNTGTAHPGLVLASVLDTAEPNKLIAVVVLADGVDVLLFRTTDLVRAQQRPMTVAAQIALGREDLSYLDFLTWRGLLRREPPRRPDPVPPAAPPAARNAGWKFGCVGSRCRSCEMRHLPPARVCVNCGSVDEMSPENMADTRGTVVTFTVDRLAFSLAPPVVAAVVDFDGGGRMQCELTDVDADRVAIGDRVEMTFRRLFTANGVQNYFWKARPTRAEEGR